MNLITFARCGAIASVLGMVLWALTRDAGLSLIGAAILFSLERLIYQLNNNQTET